VVTVMVPAVVTVFGFGARRGMSWVFVLGMSLYFLDGALCLLLGGWMSVAFHLLALFGILGGLRAARELNVLDQVVVAEAD